MSVEHIEVNDHELTAFDLPPEPSEVYTVFVDGLGEIVVEKGKPPKEKDVPAMYMRKLVPELCEQNAELHRENAKLREQVERLHADQAHWELGNCPSCPNIADLQEALEQNAKLRELCRDMYEMAYPEYPSAFEAAFADRIRELEVVMEP